MTAPVTAPVTAPITAPVTAMMMAMDRNRLIGSSGGLPWHIPGELAYFKQTTMGKAVIMGRKTYESLPKPLAGRVNIVVTSNPAWQPKLPDPVVSDAEVPIAQRQDSGLQNTDSTAQVVTVQSLDAAMQAALEAPAANKDEVMLIGGAALCRQAMPMVERLYLTYIDHEYTGDTWLDSFHWDDWQQVSRTDRDPAGCDGLAVSYLILERAAA